MNCPRWRPLLAHRFDPALVVPDAWPEAREHLRDCAACRRRATAIDPTLVFRGAARWRPAAGESAEIRQAVHTLRRAAELERRAGVAGGAARSAAPSRPTGVTRRKRGPQVAAALFALILALQPSSVSRNTASEAVPAEPQLLRAARPAAPAIEGVDRPDARVYEWGADDLSVVMIVDESLDV